jgi:hypothetical protein
VRRLDLESVELGMRKFQAALDEGSQRLRDWRDQIANQGQPSATDANSDPTVVIGLVEWPVAAWSLRARGHQIDSGCATWRRVRRDVSHRHEESGYSRECRRIMQGEQNKRCTLSSMPIVCFRYRLRLTKRSDISPIGQNTFRKVRLMRAEPVSGCCPSLSGPTP